MLVLCWPKLALSCPMLTLCWPQLPLSCPYVAPMFAYVGLGNALPHSSDRKGGGGNGVGTGWGRVGRRLGRHASITFGYHRRPPARTRAGPVGRRPDWRATAHAADPSPWGFVNFSKQKFASNSNRIQAHAMQSTQPVSCCPKTQFYL